MSAPISKAQIGAIHALKARARLDDDTYRDWLERQTGARSSKALTMALAARAIDGLKKIVDPTSSVPRRRLDGPYAPKLRALWISAWHLGLARDRRDTALLAFVRRQTGVDHTRWLREPADAMKAIEGLKAWLARDGGVRWANHPDDPKLCVVEAQRRLLGAATPDIAGLAPHAAMQLLGERIRARAADPAPSLPPHPPTVPPACGGDERGGRGRGAAERDEE